MTTSTYDPSETAVVKNMTSVIDTLKDWLPEELQGLFMDKARNEGLMELVDRDRHQTEIRYQQALTDADLDTAMQLTERITTLHNMYAALAHKAFDLPDDAIQTAIENGHRAATQAQGELLASDPGRLDNQRLVTAAGIRDKWALAHAHPEEKEALIALTNFQQGQRGFFEAVSDWRLSRSGDVLGYLLKGAAILAQKAELVQMAQDAKAKVLAANAAYKANPPYMVK